MEGWMVNWAQTIIILNNHPRYSSGGRMDGSQIQGRHQDEEDDDEDEEETRVRASERRERARARERKRWGAMVISCPRGRKCWSPAATSAAAARIWPRTRPWWKLVCRWAPGTLAPSCSSRWTSAASTPSTCHGSVRTRGTDTRSVSTRSSCNACARCRRPVSRSSSPSPRPSLLRSSSSSSARVTCLFRRTWFLFTCQCGVNCHWEL